MNLPTLVAVAHTSDNRLVRALPPLQFTTCQVWFTPRPHVSATLMVKPMNTVGRRNAMVKPPPGQWALQAQIALATSVGPRPRQAVKWCCGRSTGNCPNSLLVEWLHTLLMSWQRSLETATRSQSGNATLHKSPPRSTSSPDAATPAHGRVPPRLMLMPGSRHPQGLVGGGRGACGVAPLDDDGAVTPAEGTASAASEGRI